MILRLDLARRALRRSRRPTGWRSSKCCPRKSSCTVPDKTQPIVASAHYPDGTVRDVTREANISSNTPEIADVDSNARVKGERKGEAALLVRYEGKFVAVPVTVLNPNPGFAWKQSAAK